MKLKTFLLSLMLLVLLTGCKNLPEQGRQGDCQRAKVLAFTATWCGPCQRAKPTLVQIRATGADVEIIDIDAQPVLAQKFGITKVPTFIVYVCEKEPVRTNDIRVVASLTRRGSK